ncbi:hypothetical protein HID58_035510 [Brassica napus]|uniref:Uncharacterized protein n=1 Tax=Brassica napus TaxID=3708 RepID=A0ABQ8C542_BRANA|nr:hypothetical protein HID58_035510 [Brassica napus]
MSDPSLITKQDSIIKQVVIIGEKRERLKREKVDLVPVSGRRVGKRAVAGTSWFFLPFKQSLEERTVINGGWVIGVKARSCGGESVVKLFSGRWRLIKLRRRRLKSPGGGWLLQQRLVVFVFGGLSGFELRRNEGVGGGAQAVSRVGDGQVEASVDAWRAEDEISTRVPSP